MVVLIFAKNLHYFLEFIQYIFFIVLCLVGRVAYYFGLESGGDLVRVFFKSEERLKN